MEDDQQFCLRWNNHQSTLIQNFDTLLESGTLVDCTLAAEGKYLKAHKVVLSACSPYFEGLLSEHYDKHPVFILKDVKFKELKAMMDYMYRGEVNISQDQLAALLKAAESLQIKGLSESKTGGNNGSKTDSSRQQQKVVTQPTAPSLDIPHASSGLTIEKNNKVPRQSMAQSSVGDLPEDSASPQQLPKGLSSREGSQSPTSRKRKRFRRRSVGDDNSIENHDASNSSDMPQQTSSVPLFGITPIADEKTHTDQADPLGRSALMQQLTKPAEETLQLPLEKPEPTESLIEPKSEYLEDKEESVEDLTFDDDMNDLNEMEQDNNRAGPSHDPSQHPGLAAWHVTGDRSNAGGVGSVAGAPGATDEVFLAAQEAAQAHRDSQEIFRIDHSYGKKDTSEPVATIAQERSHVRRTVYRPDYLCAKCGRGYEANQSLVRHMRYECDVEPRFKCPYCDKRCKRRSALDDHILRMHKDRVGRSVIKYEDEIELSSELINRNYCEAYLGNVSYGTNPKVNVEGKFSRAMETQSVTIFEKQHSERHYCLRCPKSYANAWGLKRHVDFECDRQPQFKCPHCGIRMKQRGHIYRHIRRRHRGKHVYSIDPQ